jgi:DNA-binding LacI/PurR family transcriptional regulator
MSRKDEKWEEAERYVLERVGRRLPGEREFAQELGISRPRLRSILSTLESEGRIERRQGSGTYALRIGDNDLRRVVLLLDATLKLGDDPFVSRLVDMFQNSLQNAGIQCFIQRAAREADSGNSNFNSRTLWPRHDGVISIGMAGYELIRNGSSLKPSVALMADSRARPSYLLSLLQIDDEDAGAQATRHLLQKGVRAIRFFGWPQLPAVRDRLQGVRRELEGLESNVSLDVIPCGMNYGAGFEQGIQSILSEVKTGFIAANDWLAVGLQAGLQSKNPEWRQNIYLASFDGLPFAQRYELSIDSLEVPIETMVADAISELYRLQKRVPQSSKLKRTQNGGRIARYSLEWSHQDLNEA